VTLQSGTDDALDFLFVLQTASCEERPEQIEAKDEDVRTKKQNGAVIDKKSRLEKRWGLLRRIIKQKVNRGGNEAAGKEGEKFGSSGCHLVVVVVHSIWQWSQMKA